MTGLHEFKAGTLDATKCVHCKRTEELHYCDVCGKEHVAVQLKYGNMLMCGNCIETDDKLHAEAMKPENVQARVEQVNAKAIEVNEVLKHSREIDNSIQVNTDIFNAATVAIVDIKKAIDEDANITNKPYALAEELKSRFEKFQNLVFEAQKTIVEATNNQRAIQSYLNQLANTLRAEEREKLKIQDLNYQPKAVKPASPKPIKTNGTTASRKSNKADIAKFAEEFKVPEHMVVMLMKVRGITAEAAAKEIRKSIDGASVKQ